MPTVVERGTLLFVDDDADALRFFSHALAERGHEVLTAERAAEALDVAEARRAEIDAVVLDLMMPGEMDGYGLCEAVRGRADRLADVPLVVLSAKAEPQDMARSVVSGAFQHITKPVDPNYLVAVVESMIRLKRIQDDARETAEKFSAVFDNAPLGIAVVDRDWRVTELNRFLRQRHPAARPGMPEYEAFYDPPRSEPCPDHPLSATLESGDIKNAVLAVGEGAEATWLDMSTAPVCDRDGAITGAIVIIRDVTEERRTARRLEEEMKRTKANEKRLRAMVIRTDGMNETLINMKRELLEKTSALEEANAKLEEMNDKLEILSTVDELTQLFNRRHFHDKFPVEVHRARRYGHTLSVLMMDIDHFKDVNDTHGHQVGDEVLRAIGAILRDALRESDLVARYGGEEFIAVLPETRRKDALLIAERIRATVESGTFRAGGVDLSVTISIGVCTATGDHLDAELMVADADAALYEAKETGRNRVVCFDASSEA